MKIDFKQTDLYQILSSHAILETEMDSYKVKGKLNEPMHCTDCGAVFNGGLWQWLDKPVDAHQTICPACTRISENL